MAGKKKAQKKVAEKSVPRGGVWNATADPDGVRKKLFPGMTKAQVEDKHKDVAQKMRMINEPPFTPFSEMNYLQKYEELKKALRHKDIKKFHEEYREEQSAFVNAFSRGLNASDWQREKERREYDQMMMTLIMYRKKLLEERLVAEEKPAQKMKGKYKRKELAVKYTPEDLEEGVRAIAKASSAVLEKFKEAKRPSARQQQQEQNSRSARNDREMQQKGRYRS